MNKNYFRLMLMMLMTYGFTQGQGSSWQRLNDNSGISVWYQSDTVNNIYKVRIESNVKISYDEINRRLLDVENYPKYVNRCESSEIIKKTSDSSFIYYTVTDVPFPLKKRDIVVELKVKTTGKTKTIIVLSKPGVLAAKAGFERIEDYSAIWVITKTGTTTNIKLSMELGIPGYVPDWVKRQFIIEGPVETFKNFIKLTD